MTEYTPLSASGRGSTTAVRPKSVDDKFREELILTTTCEWVKADPDTARDFAIETKTLKEAQRQETGALKGKNEANLYVKYRMPQPLLDLIRLVFNWAEETYDMEFEVFGIDDKDMKLLVRNFPELFGNAHNMTWGK